MKKKQWLFFIILIIILIISACHKKQGENSSKLYEIDDGSRKATNCDCRIFTDGDFIWKGDSTNGYADGEGSIIWTRTSEKYTGTVQMGHITGKGTRTISNSLIYQGEWVDGKYSGKGILYFNKNVIYQGNFVDGEKSGEGTSFFEDGKILYKGIFEDGLPNGYGEKYDTTGVCIRSGFFHDGLFNDESEAQKYASVVARNVVKKVFNGGINIMQELYAARYNEDNAKKEFILDIRFNGNIFESKEYVCRVLCRNYYPEIEILTKNDNVEVYLLRNKIRDSILGEKDEYNFFSEE